jgi:hypothetical protein
VEFRGVEQARWRDGGEETEVEQDQTQVEAPTGDAGIVRVPFVDDTPSLIVPEASLGNQENGR